MKKITPYSQRSDVRGRLVGIMNEGQWEEFNYLETKAGQVRGNHFHRDTVELFFIIDGDIDVVISNTAGNEEIIRASAGDILKIEPGENHTFYCLTDCRWINFLTNRFCPDSPDIHFQN